MFYKPEDGHGLPHDPLKAIVAPRPIGWISTLGSDGAANLAPFSLFNMLSSIPRIIYFSADGEKGSTLNARATGEFVANFVGVALAEKMNATSVNAPHGVSEFGYAGLTPAPCQIVKPPRVAEAHAALECKVTEIFHPKSLDGYARSIIVAGQVVGVHIDDAMLNDGLFDTKRAGALARLGYMDYAAVENTFEMFRPHWKED